MFLSGWLEYQAWNSTMLPECPWSTHSSIFWLWVPVVNKKFFYRHFLFQSYLSFGSISNVLFSGLTLKLVPRKGGLPQIFSALGRETQELNWSKGSHGRMKCFAEAHANGSAPTARTHCLQEASYTGELMEMRSCKVIAKSTFSPPPQMRGIFETGN